MPADQAKTTSEQPQSQRRIRARAPKARRSVGSSLNIEFIANPDVESWCAQIAKLRETGRKAIALRPVTSRNLAIVERIAERMGDGIIALDIGVDVVLPNGMSRIDDVQPDAVLIVEEEPQALSVALIDYVDSTAIDIVAPVTACHSSKLPLFLISIPKAGTHLLFRFAEALGYKMGGPCPDNPLGGYWYYLEYSNAHTPAASFFVEATRKSPLGNRAHPFLRSGALFGYRNPLDVLVSEAAYYHKDGNSPFAGYLAPLSAEERLLRLIDDESLLGSLRDRMMSYSAWFNVANVIPVAFEELVGHQGGGSDDARRKLIWSIQLKLQVSGNPEDYAAIISERASPTFREGRIGSFKTMLKGAARKRLEALPQDFMNIFGFGGFESDETLPARANEFRHRPLTLGTADFGNTPFAVQTNFLEHNLIAFRGRYYGVPCDLGKLDLDSLAEPDLANFRIAENLDDLKSMLAARAALRRGFADDILDQRLSALQKAVQPAIEHTLTSSLEPVLAKRLQPGLEASLRSTLESVIRAAILEDVSVQVNSSVPELVAAAVDPAVQHVEATAVQITEDVEKQLQASIPELVDEAVGPAIRQYLEKPLAAEFLERLRVDIVNAIYSPLAAELHRELTHVMTPQMLAAVSPLIEDRIRASQIGAVHSIGSILGYNLFRRRDAILAVPRKLGAVDPHDFDLARKAGVVSAGSGMTLWPKLIWTWLRWAYWDGAKV